MNETETNHLTSEEMLAAIVDEAALEADRARHMAACPECRKRYENATVQLFALGERARACVPPLSKSIDLSKAMGTACPKRCLTARPALAFASAVCLLLIVLAGWQWRVGLPTTEMAFQSGGAQQLLQEVDRLVENAIPINYQELIESDPYKGGDDFMDFIVPAVDEFDDATQSPANHNGKEALDVELV